MPMMKTEASDEDLLGEFVMATHVLGRDICHMWPAHVLGHDMSYVASTCSGA